MNLIHEDCPLLSETINNVPIMDYFVVYVDWRAKHAQGTFESLLIREPHIWTQDSWSAAGSDAEQKGVIVKLGTLLGEECKITTDMRMERIRTEWRTADGIVLKEEEIGGRAPNPEDWTVVELQRRPVELSEVMPPADIFERARWGLSR